MRNIVTSLCVATVLSGVVQPAISQEFPNRALRMIQPFEPGGGTDLLARMLARKLAESFGQPVVVENRTGAGGTIGNTIAAKAAPDGYTLLFAPGAIAVNVTLYPQLPYDTLKELAPVSLLANQANVVSVHPSVPVNNIRELLALLKARPGQVNYASGGHGSATHLAPELFKVMTNLNMVHVPFKGSGPAMASTMAGDSQVVFATVSAMMPHAKAGKLRPLAVTTDKRSPLLPDLPTVAESGVPGYEFSTWYSVMVTGGTPRPIVNRLNAEVVKVMRAPDMGEGLTKLGLDVFTSTPEQFAAYLKNEIEKWGKVVRAAGLKPE